MRGLAFLLVALLVPLVGATPVQDRSVGLNLAFTSPGLWDVWAFDAPGGPIAFSLTWQETGVFPFADYDLRLYKPGAMSDQQLLDSELLLESSHHPYAHHSEHIDANLAPAQYWVAAVPWQTQGELYTLDASAGHWGVEEWSVGFVAYQP